MEKIKLKNVPTYDCLLEVYIGDDVYEMLLDVQKELTHQLSKKIPLVGITELKQFIEKENPLELTKFENEFFLYSVVCDMRISEWLKFVCKLDTIELDDIMVICSTIIESSYNKYNK